MPSIFRRIQNYDLWNLFQKNAAKVCLHHVQPDDRHTDTHTHRERENIFFFPLGVAANYTRLLQKVFCFNSLDKSSIFYRVQHTKQIFAKTKMVFIEKLKI